MGGPGRTRSLLTWLINYVCREINEKLDGERDGNSNLNRARKLDIGLEEDWAALRTDIRRRKEGMGRFEGCIMSEFEARDR